MNDEIPVMQEPEIYEISKFINSGFVEMQSNEKFDIKMQYPIMGMQNAESRCFVRREVYEKLVKAYEFLPDGYRFRIFDAWRPFNLQKELYDVYSKLIIKKYDLTSMVEEAKKIFLRKFISEPINNPEVPPVHTTGGAVDLTIIDSNGIELDMGTGFDDFSKKAQTAFFEHSSNSDVRDNRRLLYKIMTQVGFTNLPSEWWHYDYGDRFWAYYQKSPAMFRGVFTKEEIYKYGKQQEKCSGNSEESQRTEYK